MTVQATAPFTLEVTSGPTASGSREDFELPFSRRALARLKARLGRHSLEDLLKPDITAAAS
jgi:hypothetical protein